MLRILSSKKRIAHPAFLIAILLMFIFYCNMYCLTLGLFNKCLLIAFFLGVKHGFDLDHIATIDNITNYLTRQKIKASFVGFYFSIGHSLSVFTLTLLTILFVHNTNLIDKITHLHSDKIDILISSSMLTLLGTLNLVSFLKAKLNNEPKKLTGVKAKLILPITRLIKKPWHTLPIGILFGFGFDTATEIALLGITAFQSQYAHINAGDLLILPINFSLGMCLVDLSISLTLSKLQSAISARFYLTKFLTLGIVLFAFFVAITQIKEIV